MKKGDLEDINESITDSIKIWGSVANKTQEFTFKYGREGINVLNHLELIESLVKIKDTVDN